MARIVWTPTQKNAVAELAFTIRNTNPDITDLECVRLAMEALIPPVEHRHLFQMQQVPFVTKKWKEIIEEQASSQRTIKAAAVELQLMEDAIESHEMPAVVVEDREKPFPRAINPVDHPDYSAPATQQKPLSIADVSTESLAKELMSRLLKEMLDTSTLKSFIQDEINNTLEARLPNLLLPRELVQERRQEKMAPVDSAPQAPKPKVCVIGLMSKQKELLKRDYKDHIQFFHLEGNEGGSRILNTASTMDLTIKTQWVKGTMPSMKGVSNFTHATGMDSIRTLIAGRFHIHPAK